MSSSTELWLLVKDDIGSYFSSMLPLFYILLAVGITGWVIVTIVSSFRHLSHKLRRGK